jgi:protein TonB
VKIVKVIPRQFDAGRLMAPKSVPKEIATIKEEELPPASERRCRRSRRRPGWRGRWYSRRRARRHHRIRPQRGVASASSSACQGVEKPKTPQRITIGGNVQQAKLVRQPKPVYPPLAKQARISGVVIWRR